MTIEIPNSWHEISIGKFPLIYDIVRDKEIDAIDREIRIISIIADIPVADVESLLVGLILDGKLEGEIDQVGGVLLKQSTTVDNAGVSSASQIELCNAMDQMATALESFGNSASTASMKESGLLRGMAH